MAKTPNIFCLVSGASEGREPLNAFDNALLEAGVGDINLMRVSSILPPGSSQVNIMELDLPKGGIVPLAFAHTRSTAPGQYISSAVAAGIPEDASLPGVIMEYAASNRNDTVETKARNMVVSAFEKRNRSLKDIRSVSIEHRVEQCGASFAGVVLWYE